MSTLASFAESTAFAVLNNFLGEFNSKNGYALPSQYEVVITSPVTSPGKGDARQVSLSCHSVAMPGRALNTFPDTNMYGIQPDIVGGMTFAGTIDMSFYANSDLQQRVFFESWQELAWDRGTWNVGYYKDYIKDMEIYILDRQNTRRFGIKCFECYPKDISSVELDSTQATGVIKIAVHMTYKYWQTLDINNQPPNLLEKVFDTIIGGAERSINANIPKVLSRL